jgi:hypothetical protein
MWWVSNNLLIIENYNKIIGIDYFTCMKFILMRSLYTI